MKIAFIYDVLYPYVKGGAERRFYELANRLCQRHEVHLFSMKYWDGDDVIQRENGIILHGVCPSEQLYRQGKRYISQPIIYSIKLIKPLFLYDFDLVDCSSIPFFPTYSCKFYTQFKRIPFIVTWHEYWGDYWYSYLNSKWKGFLGKKIEEISSKLTDHIIAVSDHTKADLVRYNVLENKITVIGNGIGCDEINSIPPSDLVSDVIFAGRLIDDKRVNVLIRAISILRKDLPEIRCYIIGDGPERNSLETLCRELGLEKNIKMLGFFEDHKNVYALMKASRVFVLPSVREGYGIVIPEANACGIPVVTVEAKLNAASSLITHGQNGFVSNLDAREIASFVYQLLTDHALYLRMHQAAINFATNCDWNIVAKNCEQVYLNAIG